MNITIELNESQTRDFRNICHHYRYIFNTNYVGEHHSNKTIKSVKTLSKKDDDRFDHRFYKGVRSHLEEKNFPIKHIPHHLYFRLSDVMIVKGSFIFHDILFTFPSLAEMLDYNKNEKIIAKLKFSLNKNKLSVRLCEGEYRLCRNKHKKLYHFYNNLDGLDYTERPSLSF